MKNSPTRLSIAQAHWLRWLLRDRQPSRHSRLLRGAIAGFSLLELLVVMVMVGILAALAAPSWSNFANNQRVGTAQDAALRALRKGQATARQKKLVWEVCFRDTGDNVEFSVHQAGAGGCRNAVWEPLLGEAKALVQISSGNSNFVGGGPYSVQFNSRGWVATKQDGSQYDSNRNNVGKRISFAPRDRENLDYFGCVFVETLLGGFRVGRDDVCKKG